MQSFKSNIFSPIMHQVVLNQNPLLPSFKFFLAALKLPFLHPSIIAIPIKYSTPGVCTLIHKV